MHGGDVNAVQSNEAHYQLGENISCISYREGIHASPYSFTGCNVSGGSG